jgi:glycosyltransferase involved in cell wall biosynthesis
VARFVPEKGLHDLFAAFNGLEEDYELVIAGDADHETGYSRRLRSMAALNNRIKLIGYVTGENLNQIFSHASLFCLPSYHEGLPIALLEAMSYELPVLVSDIPANKEVSLSEDYYFRCGNIGELRKKMKQFIGWQVTNREHQDYGTLIQEKYNWETIARQTINVYEKAIHPNGKFPSQEYKKRDNVLKQHE